MYFKGEIYNKRDLGFEGSDLEVVIKVYLKWGINGFARLRGAFAFAIDDGNKTILVRDQFGSVPFYYYINSDIKKIDYSVSVKLLLNNGVPRIISKRGLATFMAYGCVMHPWTMIKDVRSVLPGSCVVYNKETGTISYQEYWRPVFTTRDCDLSALQEHVTGLLLKSVERQLNKGGNPAAFLSGGIDSSAIVALMRKLDADSEIRTYCITTENPKYNENIWAKKVAERNNTKHQELKITEHDILQYFDEALRSYDQPSVDGLNFWYGCRILREVGENVMLSGEAGDELFFSAMGKQVYAHSVDHFIRWIPRSIGSILERLASTEKARKCGQLMGAEVPTFFITRRIISEMRIKCLLKREFVDFSALSHPCIDIKQSETDVYNYISWMDIRNFGADMYQRDGYHAGAYHGITMRMPLYDVDLAELLYTVPGRLKYSTTSPKFLLVNACDDGIPSECVHRSKAGFSLPFTDYLKAGLKARIDEFLRSDKSWLFNSKALRRMGELFYSGKIYWSNVWIAFMAENWCRVNNVRL